ncbi:Glycerol-3-phosphate acyltransferase [Koleobacter methoxysyntrophicus]|uniref:Glycerol-3-phosphate acyltransferase n=2 Tax=Koleobacter methoxysyntrophicus TaxID=2751313 RepID=A0A8A0RQF9_9FIRM|nr:Glycerol-3-phosphate acyltransferase [Koleobacter methoxysyntrophicus]
MFFKMMSIIISYLLGSISFSYFIAKIWMGIDIRNYGSGNAGATNVLRVLGTKPAIIALLGDALKGIIAVYLGKLTGDESIMLLCGLAVVIGHNWPIFLKFKGGKGIATSLGVILTISPLSSLILIIIGVFIIYITRYVSLGSITSAIILPFIFYMLHKSGYYLVFALVLTFLALFRHRSNIQRLLSGKESKLGEKKTSRVK